MKTDLSSNLNGATFFLCVLISKNNSYLTVWWVSAKQSHLLCDLGHILRVSQKMKIITEPTLGVCKD